MEIKSERINGTLIACVEGRIDGANAQEFESAMQNVIADTDRALLLDLVGLSYISSAGLRVILLLAKSLAKHETKFALCGLSAPIKTVFEISGFNKIIAIHESREDAVASFG